ncbi:MAG: hypothetical protein IPM52_02875 [Bacteroidetes bacterium]|nr:hypothetical protein [Bacteroidota bacterium]
MLTRQSDKKKEESEVLRAWLQIGSDLPKGRIVSSESPDFLWHISRRKIIGIELTKLMFPFSAAHIDLGIREGRWHLIQKLNQLIVSKNELIPLYLSNTRSSEIWLLVDCDDMAFGYMHHLLPGIGEWLAANRFSRIDLFFGKQSVSYKVK